MTVTAVICTYDRYHLLADAILSLRRQSVPHDTYQILVVDNSPDAAKSRQFAATVSDVANLRFLHVEQAGLSHARNVAVREATTPYVAFLDDDAIAASDWLVEIVEFFEHAEQDVAVVGGPVTPIWEAPRPSWLHDELLGYVGLLNRGDQLREIGPPEWLIGGNIAFRRQALVDVEGFRTDLGRQGTLLISNEELELQTRLCEADWRLFYNPKICVSHRVPQQRLTQAWMRKRIFWQAVSDLIATPTESGPEGRSAFGFLNRETSNPEAFSKEFRQLLKTATQLGTGQKT